MKISLDKRLEQLKQQSSDLDKQVAEKDLADKNAEEERKRIEEENRKPYKVFGRDIEVKDPDFVEYYKNKLKMMTIQYKLVGSFDDDGNYSVPTEMKYELVEMEKEIDEGRVGDTEQPVGCSVLSRCMIVVE